MAGKKLWTKRSRRFKDPLNDWRDRTLKNVRDEEIGLESTEGSGVRALKGQGGWVVSEGDRGAD